MLIAILILGRVHEITAGEGSATDTSENFLLHIAVSQGNFYRALQLLLEGASVTQRHSRTKRLPLESLFFGLKIKQAEATTSKIVDSTRHVQLQARVHVQPRGC